MNTLHLVFFSLSSAGLAYLYLRLLQPNQLLHFMSVFLTKVEKKNVFIFKRLGGCALCTHQLFIDLTYFTYILLYPVGRGVFLYIIYYFLYSGISHYFGQILFGTKEKTEYKVEKEKIKL